jgi:hypothetical protein
MWDMPGKGLKETLCIKYLVGQRSIVSWLRFAHKLQVEKAFRIVSPTKYVSFEVYGNRNRTISRNFDSNQNDREYSICAIVVVT